MAVMFQNYKLGYQIVSLATDEYSRQRLINDNLPIVYVDNESISYYPGEIVLSRNPFDIEEMRKLDNYDVLEIWENGILNRIYSDKSEDNFFFITGACNSNCVMCPSPDISRRNAKHTSVEELLEIARHIPSDAPHLTITGGEPFLIGERIFPFIQFLKQHFPITEFLFLTNGRIFSIEKYLQMFVESAPHRSIIAIPVHGSCEQIHDSITRAEGSFKQTKHGIKQLLKYNMCVEIRLVVSKLNLDDFDAIADLIISQFKGIAYVSIIAMEMTGNARVNKEQVWVPYKRSFESVSHAVRKLLENGVDVKLYNFPLCTVNKPFWTLCEKSISPDKVRYAENCDLCRYKHACGGVFAGTYLLEKNELKAIL